MIVKDESHVIDRCLSSVKGLIDHWVICDTGSTDDTIARIEEALRDVPGTLYRRPWVDFGTNRSEAIALARDKADYILMIDADMTVEFTKDAKTGLAADSYLIPYKGSFEFRQKLLVHGRRPYRYVGSTHEYIETDGPERVEHLDSIWVRHHADGVARPTKLLRDLDLLTRALALEPKNPRTVFYLAQTYRDLGRSDEAIEYYQMRSEMGGWEEEVFYSMYQAASLFADQVDDWGLVFQELVKAWERRPWRLEPVYQIITRLRQRQEYHTAIVFAQHAIAQPYPSRDILFVHRWMYVYGIPLEFARCCAALGYHDMVLKMTSVVLGCKEAPSRVHDEATRLRDSALARRK